MEQSAAVLNGNPEEQPILQTVNRGVSKAISGLSEMVGKPIDLTDFSLSRMLVRKVPELFGGPEALMVGVYLQSTGQSEGHMIVGYDPAVACKLIGLVLGQTPDSVLNLSEMDQSVLGEIGNVMGSFFLNTLADSTGVRLLPSPPAVMVDMAGAILDVPLAYTLSHGDYTYLITAAFSAPDGVIEGKFIVMPVPGFDNNKEAGEPNDSNASS
jgi:chemotaxis protein CheC